MATNRNSSNNSNSNSKMIQKDVQPLQIDIGQDVIQNVDITPEEKTVQTGTDTPAPVQAGFAGNTLPPDKPPVAVAVALPPPDSHHLKVNWHGIRPAATTIYVGAKMKGRYQNMKQLAYFTIMQTPPSGDDIYGDFSIFVEGYKVGGKVGKQTFMTAYHFDFNHLGTYTIEFALVFESAFVTRVELWVDGAATGLWTHIRDINMREWLLSLPSYMLLDSHVTQAYLQEQKRCPNSWGSIVERPLN